MELGHYTKILRNWRLEPADTQDAVELPGSPERTVSRKAITDTEGRRWVLEEVAEESYSRKLAIAETMETLKTRGLDGIHPYERNTLGQLITCYAGRLCMLRPHVAGIPLNRKNWLEESWRAEAMAHHLIKMQLISEPSPLQNVGPLFSIADFVKRRTEVFRKHRNELAEALEPVFNNLEKNLFPKLGKAPTSFCHGDFHPLNIIWGEKSIQSVIDWEFCGLKPEAYDAALLVGCIGFDNPDALIGDFTGTLIKKTSAAAIFSPESWEWFIDLVIAIRYGWLAEWMRTNDESARDLEMLYMNLLTTQKGYIADKWGLS
ncbi:hypothetical protein PDESU_03409 [Pontiella desulfatans]|uniref:Aminoglycoside phosphotransferase domain-containing protein n=1 Tax=Pontiella desulfatans TaxID=2750659 RepID=A0A6C2U4D7_PONDE|nr:aminoglycoside phosphotransferase family protein [Pontiella desulfatans]VGO14840.1 hypothetical protein PDESU_03409 [Pontiella desulfatans]